VLSWRRACARVIDTRTRRRPAPCSSLARCTPEAAAPLSLIPPNPSKPHTQHKQTDAILRVTSTAVCGSDLHLYLNGVPGMQKGALFCAQSPI